MVQQTNGTRPKYFTLYLLQYPYSNGCKNFRFFYISAEGRRLMFSVTYLSTLFSVIFSMVGMRHA